LSFCSRSTTSFVTNICMFFLLIFPDYFSKHFKLSTFNPFKYKLDPIRISRPPSMLKAIVYPAALEKSSYSSFEKNKHNFKINTSIVQLRINKTNMISRYFKITNNNFVLRCRKRQITGTCGLSRKTI